LEMVRPTFPKTLREFRERFATESACLNYLWDTPMAAFQTLLCLASQRNHVSLRRMVTT